MASILPPLTRQIAANPGAVHGPVQRPWGHYTVLVEMPGVTVKRLVIDPGAATSMQLHRHRNEHWTVESGTAQVTRGDATYEVVRNASTSIAAGMRHRLENAGPEPLAIIEIQMGSYLGEDDIVRFDDRYGRATQPSPMAT